MTHLDGATLLAAITELGLNKTEASAKGKVTRKTLAAIFEDRAKDITVVKFVRALEAHGYDIDATKTVKAYLTAKKKVHELPGGPNLKLVTPPTDPDSKADSDWQHAERALKSLCDQLDPYVQRALSDSDDWKSLQLTTFGLEFYFRRLSDQMDVLRKAGSA